MSNKGRKYIHYGHKHFQPELFCPITNLGRWVKPNGGLWGSPVDASFGWKDRSRGISFVTCDDENSFTFTLAEGARILVIADNDFLKELPQVEDEHAMSTWCVLDFEKLAEDYDAIELVLSADGRLYRSLYGWDCDCILVMNPDVVVEEEV